MIARLMLMGVSIGLLMLVGPPVFAVIGAAFMWYAALPLWLEGVVLICASIGVAAAIAFGMLLLGLGGP